MTPQFTSKITVTLIQKMGNDANDHRADKQQRLFDLMRPLIK